MKIENKKERLYFTIAGIASLVLLVEFLLFSEFSPIGFFLPLSLIFFSFKLYGSILLMVISIFSTFFILKGFSIMADKENLYNLKKYIIIFFVLILIVSLVDVFFPYWNASSGIHGFASISVGEPQSITTSNRGGGLNLSSDYLAWILSSLEIFVFVLYILLGAWILKLNKKFGSLIIFVSLMYIYPGVMRFLFILIGFIIPNVDNTPTGSLIAIPFFVFLYIIKIGGYICLSLLFFRSLKQMPNR